MACANKARPLPIEILCFLMVSSKTFKFLQYFASICLGFPQKVHVSFDFIFFFSYLFFVLEENPSFLKVGGGDLVFFLGLKED